MQARVRFNARLCVQECVRACACAVRECMHMLVPRTLLLRWLLFTSLTTYLLLRWSQCLHIQFSQALCGLHLLERKVETEVVGSGLWPPLPS